MVVNFQSVTSNGNNDTKSIQENNTRSESRKVKKSSQGLRDIFIHSTGTNPESDGKFTLLQASKKFLNGILNPFKAMLKCPFLSLGIIAAGIALAILCPVTIPAMVAVGIGFGVYQFGKGVVMASYFAYAGRMDECENAFENIGGGFSTLALTAIGVRSSARIAASSKATVFELSLGSKLSDATNAGILAADKAKTFGFFRSMWENISIVITKDGFMALVNGIKPKSIYDNLRVLVTKFGIGKTNLKKQLINEEIEANPRRLVGDDLDNVRIILAKEYDSKPLTTSDIRLSYSILDDACNVKSFLSRFYRALDRLKNACKITEKETQGLICELESGLQNPSVHHWFNRRWIPDNFLSDLETSLGNIYANRGHNGLDYSASSLLKAASGFIERNYTVANRNKTVDALVNMFYRIFGQRSEIFSNPETFRIFRANNSLSV